MNECAFKKTYRRKRQTVLVARKATSVAVPTEMGFPQRSQKAAVIQGYRRKRGGGVLKEGKSGLSLLLSAAARVSQFRRHAGMQNRVFASCQTRSTSQSVNSTLASAGLCASRLFSHACRELVEILGDVITALCARVQELRAPTEPTPRATPQRLT